MHYGVSPNDYVLETESLLKQHALELNFLQQMTVLACILKQHALELLKQTIFLQQMTSTLVFYLN